MLLFGSVAVAVIVDPVTEPIGTEKLKLALHEASVVAFVKPRKVRPCPLPDGSQEPFEKYSILNCVLAGPFKVPEPWPCSNSQTRGYYRKVLQVVWPSIAIAIVIRVNAKWRTEINRQTDVREDRITKNRISHSRVNPNATQTVECNSIPSTNGSPADSVVA